ncbi:heme-binding protein [Arthrobacter sp. SLBN-53]|uniref:heme-binding protein n=1 Tax=Arthrobacter sp. SLBN-53 TaxID=2768412 RepID=UPI0011544F03|nr:heme-binding protein [Arthrobacter sp. SLBN-53]TQK29644.1 hemophore-related protein [Arthrobacter sp. SLBN-53]
MLNATRRLAIGALGAAAIAGVAAAPPAMAEPPHAPDHCTAADLAGIASGVSASTSAYLFTHQQANDFFTSLHPLPDEQKQAKVDAFFAANPQMAAELKGIRKPLQEAKIRCGDTNGDGVVDIL